MLGWPELEGDGDGADSAASATESSPGLQGPAWPGLCHRKAKVLTEVGRSWKFGVAEFHWNGGVLFRYFVHCVLTSPPLAQEDLAVICRCCPHRGQPEGLWGGCV